MDPAATPELPSLGGSIAVSFLSLGLVCLLAWVALRWLSRRGVGGAGMGPIRVLARAPLEPKRSVYLLEAAGRCFLVGVGDGPMSLLAEVDPRAVEAAAPSRPARMAPLGLRFAEVLARIRNRTTAPAPEPERYPAAPAESPPSGQAG